MPKRPWPRPCDFRGCVDLARMAAAKPPLARRPARLTPIQSSAIRPAHNSSAGLLHSMQMKRVEWSSPIPRPTCFPPSRPMRRMAWAVYSGGEAAAQLRRYLAAPVTIFLGQEDLGDENRNDGPEAVAQGKTRYERGLNAYAAAKAEAQARGWLLNWRLVELPGVGHSAAKMFSSRQALDALAP